MDLKGVLKVDHSVRGDTVRMRVIFYAEPTNEIQAQSLKKIPDEESVEAKWVTLDDLAKLSKEKPGLRGIELIEWA